MLAAGAWRRYGRLGSDRLLAAIVLASCLVVPLLFSVALRDSFSVPKLAALRLILVVGVGLLAVRFAAGGIRKPTFIGPIDAAVLAFLLLNILAFAFSIDRRQSLHGEPLQYQGLTAVFVYVGFFYLARSSLRDERRASLLLASVGAGGMLVATYALMQKAGLDPIWNYTPGGRVFSSIGQPNALAAYLVLAIPLGAALLPRSELPARLLLALGVGLMLAALAFTLSRGGYAGLVVAGAILTIPLIRSIRLSSRRLLLCGIVLAAAMAVVTSIEPARTTASQIWERALSSADWDDGSAKGHRDLWTVGAAIALDYPILGAGQETYPELFPRYRDEVLSVPRARAMSAYRPESPHNVYLAIAAGAGFPALAAYLAVIGAFVFLAMRAVKTARAEWRRAALVALLAAAAGHLVTDMFMTAEVTGSWLFWLLMGAGLAIARAKGGDGEQGAGQRDLGERP